MAKYDVLKSVPLFVGLSPDDLEALCLSVEEVRLAEGEQLFAEGDRGDKAYVVTGGELEVVKESAGRDVLLNVLHSGDVVGEMALLEHQPRMASVRARSDSTLLAISQEQLDHLLNTSLSATRSMFFTVLDRLRKTESLLRQSEKMAQLGTLTAGVAHEMNNPAAAVQRGAGQLRELLSDYAKALAAFHDRSWTPEQREALAGLESRARADGVLGGAMDALERSDRSAELEAWLEAQGSEDAWELAPALVDMGMDVRALGGMAGRFSADELPVVVRWLAATHQVHGVLREITVGAGRIADIVKALKSYSYLDQAPVQNVDLHEGLDNTLVVLHGKLKQGVQVKREYASSLPRIVAYGSELNQVWTNIIDNAIDAMEGNGTLTIRTRQEGAWIVVEIEDSGPGIPADALPHIFESFFTTKPQGKGTGLGLNITYNIVVHKHRGDIKVTSEPGRTTFHVWLPINFAAS